MEKNAIMTEVRKAVEGIFAEKEDAERQKKTEAALNKSATAIDQLTKELDKANATISDFETKESELATSIEEKDTELTQLAEAKTTLESELSAKAEELETVKAELDELKPKYDSAKKELEKTTEQLNKIEKDALAETRFVELTEAKVANKEKSAQFAKIREMSDEEFAAYKDELIELKESIIANLETSNEEDDDDSNVAPAKVTKSKASLDLEDDTLTVEAEYEDLGKAMASLMTKEVE